MAETIAHYSFIPWLRQGLSSQILETDQLASSNGTTPERAELNIQLTLEATSLDGTVNQQSIAKTVSIVGPGDVKNISERVIVRVNPPRNIGNFEANNLAYIDFYEEDFLWRYTPVSPNTANNKRLRPWLCLIVLKDAEYTIKSIPDNLPFITVKNELFNDVFHKPEESWAWAHVQLNELIEPSGATEIGQQVTDILQENADQGICRLICPRKLNPSTKYTAFLLPAFETGRRSGLGAEFTGVPAQQTSWTRDGSQSAKPRPFDFPVYFQWSFHTGNDGDFESLVSKLKPIIMEPDSGRMPMDVQEIGYGMDQKMERKTMGMEAALRPPTFELVREDFPVTNKEKSVKDQLVDFLNLSPSINRPADNGSGSVENPFFTIPVNDDPMIVPPIYGAWHAIAQNLKTGTNPDWLKELNFDFRNRAAAGLGTQVIQANQEEMMNRAWQQVEKITEANRKIQEGLLSKLINNAIYKKHLSGSRPDKLFMLTGQVQHLLLNDAKTATIAEMVRQSKIPAAAETAGFKKMVRPVSKMKSMPIRKDVITNLNKPESDSGSVTAARMKQASASALSISEATTLATGAVNLYKNDIANLAKDALFSTLNTSIIASADINVVKSELTNAVNANPDLTPQIRSAVTGMINNLQQYSVDPSNNVKAVLSQATYESSFDNFSGGKMYQKATVLNQALAAAPDVRISLATSMEDVTGYTSNLEKFGTRLSSLDTVREKSSISDLQAVIGKVHDDLKPEKTISRRVQNRVRIWDGIKYAPIKELNPVMAYPEFPEPAYEYLEKISQNFILPNIDQLPANSITLLETNQRFIESYMAGLNHEMARELLWREYPTDQRGSYFRQFWNIADNLFENSEDNKKDIKPMDKWSGKLGFNKPSGLTDILVLVVRGDLFKKYPSTMVYAQAASYDTTNPMLPRKLPATITTANTKFPLFKAELKPDITLFGFDLTAEIANGHRITTPGESTAGKNPGWFFVFKERPGQIQFGLDNYTTETGDTSQMPPGSPATWNDFTWEHLVAQKTALDNFQLNFSKSISITGAATTEVKSKYNNEVPLWASNSAEIASILYQDPVLFARHAGEMLNEELLNT